MDYQRATVSNDLYKYLLAYHREEEHKQDCYYSLKSFCGIYGHSLWVATLLMVELWKDGVIAWKCRNGQYFLRMA